MLRSAHDPAIVSVGDAVQEYGVPRLAGRLIARPRLVRQLDVAAGHPVTIVAAPAGMGKTVLIAQWIATSRIPVHVAWLTLDAVDGQLQQFQAHLASALRRSNGMNPGALDALVDAASHGGASSVEQFVAALEQGSAPVVLVLDDLHRITGSDTARWLNSLLERDPSGLQLVIGTRADPTLPALSRLRLRDELAELRADDLAFTVAETADLLDTHGVEVSDVSVESLCVRTQGWATGLRLAALWLQGSSDANADVAVFAGTDRTVADYLVAEVLDTLPMQMRQFLLGTCVVDQVCARLADALTGDDDGAHMLAALERANVFIRAVDPSRSWYRYHPLFVELLRFELRQRAPETVAPLLRRASRWHADDGSPVDAARYALAGEDWEAAVALLLRYGPEWTLRGDADLVRELADLLPGAVVRDRPELGVLLALGHVDRLDLEALDQHLAQARLCKHLVPALEGGVLLLSLLFELRACRRSGQLAQALDSGRAVLALPGPHADVVRATTLVDLGAAELWTGDLDRAGFHLRDGAALALRSGQHLVHVDGLSSLAQVSVHRGHLTAAWRRGQQGAAMAAANRSSGDHHAAGAHLALSAVSLERNELSEAQHHLESALAACADGPWRPIALGAAIVQAQLCAARGDAAGGHAVLDGARAQATDWTPTLATWLRTRTTLCDAELHFTTGNFDAARVLLDSIAGDTGDRRTSPQIAVAIARLHLLSDAAAAPTVVRTLAPWLDHGRATQSLRWLIAARLLHAVASAQLDDFAGSGRSLERALALAQPERFRRVFADGGPAVEALLRAHLERTTSYRSFIGEGLDSSAAYATPLTLTNLVESLTGRQRAVLRYLPSRLSASEIARDMYVSTHTVKSHTRQIYRKLDVTTRRAAVERARVLNLL